MKQNQSPHDQPENSQLSVLSDSENDSQPEIPEVNSALEATDYKQNMSEASLQNPLDEELEDEDDDDEEEYERTCCVCEETPESIVCLSCDHCLCLGCTAKLLIVIQQGEDGNPQDGLDFSEIVCVQCREITSLSTDVQVNIIHFLKENNLLMTEMDNEKEEDSEPKEILEDDEEDLEHEHVHHSTGTDLKELNLFEKTNPNLSNRNVIEKELTETTQNNPGEIFEHEAPEDQMTSKDEDLTEANLETIQDRSIAEILDIKEDYLFCQKHSNQELLNLYDVDKKQLLCTNCVLENRTSPFNQMRRIRLLKDCHERVIDDFRERQLLLKDLGEGLKVRQREVDLRQRELQRKKRAIEKDIQLQVEDMKKLVEETFKQEIRLASEEEDRQMLGAFEDERKIIWSKKEILEKVGDERSMENEGASFLRYLESNCYSYFGWEKMQREVENFLGERGPNDHMGKSVKLYLERKRAQKEEIEVNILDKIIEKLQNRRNSLTREQILEHKVEQR